MPRRWIDSDYLDTRNQSVSFEINDYEQKIYHKMRDLRDAAQFIDTDPSKAKELTEKVIRVLGRELTYSRLDDPNYPISFVIEFLDPDERSMWIGLRDSPDYD